ncbi:hypothetical protein CONPUDRAFT_140318 [Coniophora puteana RWD-64-598 SS2]|uniref:Uncharacterized protein n=1 Tax=Coniophora puteana (strain RWD-64-598) TaxID=741705 RepID=A0A5M3M7T3_CONPW|nr:uncharacterized protein CONPUDRAFT_140318 [Coniophora puteana RWD-64-598 SS2]EIW74966.1 hypothetical protein CONPUDRAFT_140318 [Coniophora puteana RWD-64-598 SS2]
MSSTAIAQSSLRRRGAIRARPNKPTRNADDEPSLGDFLQRVGESWSQQDGSGGQGVPHVQTVEKHHVRSATEPPSIAPEIVVSPAFIRDEEPERHRAELALSGHHQHSFGCSEDDGSQSKDDENDGGDANTRAQQETPAVRKRPASTTEPFIPFLNRSLTPSQRPISQISCTTTRSSLNLDAKGDIFPSSSRSHDAQKEHTMFSLWATAKRRLRMPISAADDAKCERSDRVVSEKTEGHGSFAFRSRPQPYRSKLAQIYGANGKESLYASTDSHTLSQYSINEEGGEKEGLRGGAVTYGSCMRPGGHIIHGSRRVYSGSFESDSMHGKSQSCFCLP